METILTAHKMRIYPNKEQIQIIETTFGATCKMFNSLHAQFLERSKVVTLFHISCITYDMLNELTQIIKLIEDSINTIVKCI